MVACRLQELSSSSTSLSYSSAEIVSFHCLRFRKRSSGQPCKFVTLDALFLPDSQVKTMYAL